MAGLNNGLKVAEYGAVPVSAAGPLKRYGRGIFRRPHIIWPRFRRLCREFLHNQRPILHLTIGDNRKALPLDGVVCGT
jgi:hypothetical protein